MNQNLNQNNANNNDLFGINIIISENTRPNLFSALEPRKVKPEQAPMHL